MAVIVGLLTVKLTVLMFVQPIASVPITVYTVVAVAVTATEAPVNAPGIHEYVVAPLAVNVEDPPLQIAVGFDTAVTVGFGLTVNEMVLLVAQTPLLPVTV